MASKKTKRSKKAKRVLVVSDFHCGHIVGLTPPEYQFHRGIDEESWWYKAQKTQRELWDWYEREINLLKQECPIDIVIANGDLIDGRGDRSGSTECITPDRAKQADMAVRCLNITDARDYVLTYGTAYHTGTEEDFEDIIVQQLRAEERTDTVKIGSHEWVDVNGTIFDCKHHLGSSSVPHARFTALAKDQLWNELWAVHDEQPRADIVIRSHVHYHIFAGDATWMGVTMPALQAMGTKFGSRRCSGRVNIGFLHFDIDADGAYAWQLHQAKLKVSKAKAVKL